MASILPTPAPKAKNRIVKLPKVALTIEKDETCGVCTDNFQKKPRKKPVECIFCNYRACVECQETYLLGSVQDAHCLNCKKSWNREFMAGYFTNVFMTETYKKHREDILMARERSMLPQRMVILDRIIRGEKMAEEITPLQDEVETLQLELAKKQHILDRKISHMGLLKNGIEPDGVNKNGIKKQAELREFHKACPADDCRGFLSTQYKCGLCSIWVCPDCHEIKGADREAAHTCKPENIESVKLKKKDCRNCPECAAEIYKEIGCDQMWCTKCQTTFDWKTGKKLTNVKVHNPHYYEYLRQTKGAVPRDPDDNPCMGAGLGDNIDPRQLLKIGLYTKKTKDKPDQVVTKIVCSQIIYNTYVRSGFMNVIQLLNHVNDLIRYDYIDDYNDTTNSDIDIRYLRKEIDEETWKQRLQYREKLREKKNNISQILMTLITIGNDILRTGIYTYKEERIAKKNVEEIDIFIISLWDNLEVLRGIVNKSFEKHAALYKCKAPCIKKEQNYVWTYIKSSTY
jgi:hypothetical protein